MFKITTDISREVKNLVLLSFISIVLGVQLLVIVSILANYIPINTNLAADLFPESRHFLNPERESLLYRFFVAAVIGIQLLGLTVFHRQLSTEKFGTYLRRFFIPAAIATILLVFYALPVKIHIDQPWIIIVLILFICLAFLSKIFAQSIDRFLEALFFRIARLHLRIPCWAADILVILIISWILFIPDQNAAVIRIFLIDYLSHLDSFIMAPGLAIAQGNILFSDNFSSYGIGLPMLFAAICKFIGGFTYENVIGTMVGLGIVYFIFCYIFLRIWLKDVLLAVLSILLAIKMQVFGYGPDSFIWQMPAGTVIRYFFDIFFLLLILLHLRVGKRQILFWTAVLTGVSVFYESDTGIYQLITFYAYLFLLLILPSLRARLYQSKKDLLFLGSYFLIPLLVVFALLWKTTGTAVFSPEFWGNVTEMMGLFLAGFCALPIYDGLRQGQYYYFFMSILFMVTYLFALIFIPASILRRAIEGEKIFLTILAIYGLGLFHYYICRSWYSGFYVVSIPFVLSICYWLHLFLKNQDNTIRKSTLIVLIICAGIILGRTEAFQKYPHLFSPQAHASESEQEKMRAAFISDEDTQLISQLTSPKDKVCLISSFTSAHLMAAQRRPFLYYSEFVLPRPMNTRDFGGLYLFTKHRMKRTIAQLEEEKPEIIFIETKLIGGILPNIYYQHYQTLSLLIAYLKSRYAISGHGRYLTILKRK